MHYDCQAMPADNHQAIIWLFMPVLSLPLLLGGCIARGHYQQLQADYKQLEASLQACQLRMSADTIECEAAKDKLVQLEQQNETLRNHNQLLSRKNVMINNEYVTAREQKLEQQRTLAQKEQALQLAAKTYEDLVKSLKDEVEEGKISIENMKDALKVSLVERIVFPAGAVDIDDSGKKVLDKVAKILRPIQNRRIEVTGHSDASPVAKGMQALYPSNWELSARRATSVVRYLQAKGVNPKLLAAVSLAHYHPIADNKSPEGKQKNRRIDIILTPIVQGTPAQGAPVQGAP